MLDIWIPLMSFAMGLFAFGLCKLIERWYAGRRVPEKMYHWQQELEHTAFDLVRAHLNVALHQQRVADMIGQLPDDFDAPCFLAARLGVAVERAVLTEAERRNFYPAGTFKNLFGTPSAQPVVTEEKGPTEQPTAEQTAADFEAMVPAIWIGNQLMPTPPVERSNGRPH